MRRYVVVLALVVTACSQPAGKQVETATVSPSQSVSPVASPSPDIPLSTVDFSCRLPVIRSATFGNFKGGFVTFPAATFAPDPRGVMTSNNQNGVLTTAASPALSGSLSFAGPPFYDAAQHRWVPVGPGQSTPDGSFYAYATWDPAKPDRSVVHVVDVAKAADRVFYIAMPVQAMGFNVADFNSLGVYLVFNRTIEQFPDGVWLMDPASGALRQLPQVSLVEAVRGGLAWLAKIDPGDPMPPQLPRSGTPSDSLISVDLVSGTTQTWFYRPGRQVSLMGFDSRGRPIVDVFDPSGLNDSSEKWLIAGPGNEVLLYGGAVDLEVPQGDGSRIWFGGYSGIYLYTASHGLQKVAAFNDLHAGESVLPAGMCG